MENKTRLTIDELIECSTRCAHVYELPVDVHSELIENTRTKYVTIEGSDTWIDWFDNASFLFRRNDMHRGFYRYARYCMHEYHLLHEFNDPRVDRVILTAHSLGAACAVISLTELAPFLRDKLRIDVVLFGCPKPGGVDFYERFQREVVRNDRLDVECVSLQNGGDIVCSVPPALFGYHLVNACTVLEAEAEARSTDPVAVPPTPKVPPKRKRKQNRVEDHKIREYTKSLKWYKTEKKSIPHPTPPQRRKGPQASAVFKTILKGCIAYGTARQVMARV